MNEDNQEIVVSNTKALQDGSFTYKSNHIFKPIPASTIDFHFFKKLYACLKEATDESCRQDIAKLKQNPGQTNEQFKLVKQSAKELYKVTIHVYGSRGEYIFTENPNIFDDPGVPDRIDRVIFENSTRFRMTLQRDPVNQCRLIFDFTTQPIFNFNISPSLATPVNSSIDVVGENETWVTGTYGKVSNLLSDRKNPHGWLHLNNIYDLFLWLAIIPIVFRAIYLLQNAMPEVVNSLNGLLKAAIYIYVFFFLLNVFRCVFNYARWVFPYLELRIPLRRDLLHRVVLGAILFSIIGSLGYDLVCLIVNMLKG